MARESWRLWNGGQFLLSMLCLLRLLTMTSYLGSSELRFVGWTVPGVDRYWAGVLIAKNAIIGF
jgi:hypothetical protein